MPIATIEVKKQYDLGREAQIIAAVHSAMMEGLKNPEWDRNIRLIVHEPHRFAAPPDKDDRYTLICVDLFQGRSLDAKKAFYRTLVARLEVLGIPRDHVKVILRETPRDNVSMQDGLAASEIDLGFEVNV
jgi:phenylpyruvate tautomerase PptA (4-oxalocrotonate tautomerase family)